MVAAVSLLQVFDQPPEFRVSLLEIVCAFLAEVAEVVAQQHKSVLEVKSDIFLSLVRVEVILGGELAHGLAIFYPVNAVGASRILTLPIVGVSLQLCSHPRNVDQTLLVSFSTEAEDQRFLPSSPANLGLADGKAEKVAVYAGRSAVIGKHLVNVNVRPWIAHAGLFSATSSGFCARNQR